MAGPCTQPRRRRSPRNGGWVGHLRPGLAHLTVWLGLAACGPGVLYAPSAGGSGVGTWLQEGGDAGGAGLAPSGPDPPLRLRWQQRIGKPPLGGALLAPPLVLQWSQAPDLLAFDLATGKRLGRRAEEDQVCGPAVLSGPRAQRLVMAILGDAPQVRGLDRTRGGDVVWRWAASVCAPLVERGDTVYAAAESGVLAALDGATGDELWRLRLASPQRLGPTLSGDTLYAAGETELAAVALDSGRVLWRRDLGAPARSRPVVDVASGHVVVALADGRLRALDRHDGGRAWEAGVTGLATGLHVSAGRVVVGSSDHRVYAFDASDGRLLWRYPTDGIVRAAPTGTGRTVYVPSGDSWLHALDAATGALRWRYRLDAPGWTPASLAGRTLAVVSARGTLFVFEAM